MVFRPVRRGVAISERGVVDDHVRQVTDGLGTEEHLDADDAVELFLELSDDPDGADGVGRDVVTEDGVFRDRGIITVLFREHGDDELDDGQARVHWSSVAQVPNHINTYKNEGNSSYPQIAVIHDIDMQAILQ